MTIRAFILIETAVGNGHQVVTALRQIKGISSADLVTGPYDVVVIVEARDLNALGAMVLRQIQSSPGVVRTLTCLITPI